MLVHRYASTERRWRALINVVIAVAVASAIFGILRQTLQPSSGFVFPVLGPEQGYGQFINRNHFAFLMEMGFGLALGVVVGGGVKRDRGLIYLAAILPLWTGLVLCNSRGGLVAMLAQIVATVLLFGTLSQTDRAEDISKAAALLKSRAAKLALIFVLVVGVVFGMLWMGGDQLAARIAATGDELPAGRIESREGVKRNEVWAATLRMFAANPIAGVGMGAYWARVPEFPRCLRHNDPAAGPQRLFGVARQWGSHWPGDRSLVRDLAVSGYSRKLAITAPLSSRCLLWGDHRPYGCSSS